MTNQHKFNSIDVSIFIFRGEIYKSSCCISVPEGKNYSYVFFSKNEGGLSPQMEAIKNAFISALKEFFPVYVGDICILNDQNKKANNLAFFGDGQGDVSLDWVAEKQSFGVFFGYSWSYITYSEGINLFYHYFTAYKILVEQNLPSEQKQEIISTDWWSKFLQELPKLETIYKDLVTKGEIEWVEEVK